MMSRHRLAALWLFLVSGVVPLQAQDFFLTVTNTPDPILIGSNINYSLSVSNATGQNLNPGEITSHYDTNLTEFVSATNQANTITNIDTNTPGLVTFEIPPNGLPINGVLEILMQLRATGAGLLTNRFRIELNDQGRTDPAETNVVSAIKARVDLGIKVVGPSRGVFVGDFFNYQLLATNAGPEEALGIVVTNPFPAHVSLIGLYPSNLTELVDGSVIFSVGKLTNKESSSATVSVLATNATNFNWITANISSPYILDDNTNNNIFSNNIPILIPELGQIIVTNLSDQELNQQTGWMEQRVLLENVSTSRVDSVRLLVEGLTNGLDLVNVTGTNWTTPYVAHGAALPAGEQLALILEYFSPNRTAGEDPMFTAYGTPQLDLTPVEGSGVTVDRFVLINFTNAPNMNDGRVLLEWPVTNSGPFQVVYDEQAGFTNAKGSLPLVTVPDGANRVQWLDYGPPRTLTAPSNATSRFYRVIELP